MQQVRDENTNRVMCDTEHRLLRLHAHQSDFNQWSSECQRIVKIEIILSSTVTPCEQYINQLYLISSFEAKEEQIENGHTNDSTYNGIIQ